MLEQVTKGFIKGKNAFLTVNPSVYQLFKFRWLGCLSTITKGIINKKSPIDIATNILASKISDKLYLNHINSLTNRGYLIGQTHSNNWKINGLGATRRTWVGPEDKSLLNKRIIKPLVIVYHHANKAGKHIDLHMGHLSVVYRVSGKPFEDKLKFNNKGRLTEESKQILLNHLRLEISKHSRVPWNHDHTISNANTDWSYDSNLIDSKGYGAGPTRQVIFKDTCEFYHPEVKSSLHIYAPLINPNQGLYAYKIYSGSTPILILGNLIPRDEKYQDRLHLTMIQEKDFKSEFLKKVDHDTITTKMDGASTYFNGSGDIKKGESFKLFSPRRSKITGHHIEYTYKATELVDKPNAIRTQGMGELLYWKYTGMGQIFKYFNFRGPEHIAWNYLSAAKIGGILNSNQVRPNNIYPEIRVYRLDRFANNKITNISFAENRKFQQLLINNLDINYWKVVSKSLPICNKNTEGLVGVPKGASINDGYKIKWRTDEIDMTIKSINLFISSKQHMAGTITCDYQGKEYNFGPGSIGDVNKCMYYLENKNNLIGSVVKTVGFNGHVGRAAKIVDIHLDK